MTNRNLRSCHDSIASKQLHRQVELGWKDLDERRLSDFDAEDIKKRGRERLAMISLTQSSAARSQRHDDS